MRVIAATIALTTLVAAGSNAYAGPGFQALLRAESEKPCANKAAHRVFFPPAVISSANVNENVKVSLAIDSICAMPGDQIFIRPMAGVNYTTQAADGSVRFYSISIPVPVKQSRSASSLTLFFADGRSRSFPSSATVDLDGDSCFAIDVQHAGATLPPNLAGRQPDYVVP